MTETSFLAAALTAAVSAVCPIAGVSIGRRDDKATWRIDYAADATDEQRAAAAAVVAGYDAAAAPYPVDKRTILLRLRAVGKLVAADAALKGANTEDGILLAERWYAAGQIMSNDADARAFLVAIGADPDAVLAR